MTESKHTPGPWEVRQREADDMFAVDEFTSYVSGFDIFGPEDRPIVGPYGIPALETDERNAALIAAAPDLLEAVKQAHEQMLHLYGKVGLTNLLRDVIAKAEGQP